jgi:hypothetical protein
VLRHSRHSYISSHTFSTVTTEGAPGGGCMPRLQISADALCFPVGILPLPLHAKLQKTVMCNMHDLFDFFCFVQLASYAFLIRSAQAIVG